jgi:co-chaperonin GroES (HSP10)
MPPKTGEPNQSCLKRRLRLRPTAGNVFILPDPEPEKSGLILKPETYRDRDMPSTGTVFAMGGKLRTKKGVLVEPEFKIGQRVVFKKFSGLFCEIGDKRLVQIKQHDVEGILDET